MPRSRNAIFINDNEHGLPYSKGVMSQTLTAAGLVPERAYALAQLIETHLYRSATRELSVDDLNSLAIDLLDSHEGHEAAQRFRRWTIMRRKDIPIILLIGGSTGSGKSTVATQVAHRLGITRITSTDMIRQTMRAFFSPELMPVLHHSSFDVPMPGTMLPESAGDPGLLGFIEQARQVSVGAQAVVQRAEREGMSTLIEGVHLVPGLMQHIDISRCAVVETVIFVEDPDTHASHFNMRGLQTDGNRPTDHYLHNFERIRQIQEYLVMQAERRGVNVLENTFIDTTIKHLLDFTLDIVEQVATDAERTVFPSEIAGTGIVPSSPDLPV